MTELTSVVKILRLSVLYYFGNLKYEPFSLDKILKTTLFKKSCVLLPIYLQKHLIFSRKIVFHKNQLKLCVISKAIFPFKRFDAFDSY